MRISLLSKQFGGGGGSERYATELAHSLARRGHYVDVFTLGDGDFNQLEPRVTITNVASPRRQLVTLETLCYSVFARRKICPDQYDIIHGTLMPASTIGLSVSLTNLPPIVLTSHSFAPSMIQHIPTETLPDYLLKYAFQPINAVMDNVAARHADRVIAISSQMKTQLTNSYRLPEEKITTIFNGVDTSIYRPRYDRHPEVSPDKFTILFVGRLISLKRPDLAIKTVAQSETHDIELLIAGTGRLKERLSELAKDLGVLDQVKFLGYVEGVDLAKLYASADVSLLLSEYEGFGLVLLESMASGTPVIARPVGGAPDLVKNNETGFIVPPAIPDIVDTVDKIVTHPAQLERMSHAARSVAKTHDWDEVADEVEDLYREII